MSRNRRVAGLVLMMVVMAASAWAQEKPASAPAASTATAAVPAAPDVPRLTDEGKAMLRQKQRVLEALSYSISILQKELDAANVDWQRTITSIQLPEGYTFDQRTLDIVKKIDQAQPGTAAEKR